jgi:hypothetical protein
MTKNKNEITKTNDNSLIFSATLDESAVNLMNADAQEYTDNTSPDELTIPRIRIIQSGSEERKKASSSFIKEAEEGDAINTLTKEIFKGDVGFLFIPIFKRIVYLEWKDRAKGGGLAKNYGEDANAFLSAAVDQDTGKRISVQGNEIVKTYDFFGYIVDMKNKKASEVVISMSKTQAKKAKNWNTIMRNLTAKDGKQLPIFAGVYKFTTAPESNDKGSWFNYNIDFAGYTLAIPEVGKIAYEKAKNFIQSIKDIKVSYEDEDATSSTDSNDDRM